MCTFQSLGQADNRSIAQYPSSVKWRHIWVIDRNRRWRTLRLVLVLFTIITLSCSPAMAGNQLYTGDPSTVPVGRLQFQLFQDTTPKRAYRLAGTAVTYGITPNLDMRAAYSRLWSTISPDAKIGPNFGFKWRFAGDGRREPSLAISGLYSTTSEVGGDQAKPDYGALLLFSYPSRYVTLLGNFGRVWVGEQRPDLYYLSFAATRRVSPYTLFALEYSDLRRIGQAPNQGVDAQYAAGIVYTSREQISYSFQAGYLPNNPRFSWRTTLGFSVYF